MAQEDPLLAFSADYLNPPKFFIEFLTPDRRPLFVHDPFNTANNPFTVTKMDVTLGMGQTGGFDITVDDSVNRVIDREILDCGCRVVIHGGRSPLDATKMMTGIVPVIKTHRRGASGFVYEFNGIGLESILGNYLMNVKFKAPIDPTTSRFIMHERYKAKNVIRDIFTNPNYMIPTSKKPNVIVANLQDVTGINLEGISEDLNDPIFELDFNQTSVAQILSSIEDQINVDIFLNAEETLVAQYPTGLHSGMTLKTIQEQYDDADTTGYVQGEHDFTDSISSSDYADHLVGVGKISSDQVGSTDMSGYLSLYNKDISQQIPVSAAHLENSAIILERVGAGTNANNPVTYKLGGAILEDDNDSPSSRITARFFIPVIDIPQNPTQVNVTEFVRTSRPVDPSKRYWLTLYEIGNSEENTIRWYHDNSIGQEVKTMANAIRPLPFGRTSANVSDQFSDKGWRIGWTGPTFSYIFQSKESHEVVMKNTRAVKRWGRKDARISNLQQGITDSGSMLSTMAAMLENSATKERTYSFDDVIIPLKFFMPGQLINFVDPAVGITSQSNYSLTIQEVTYQQESAAHPKGNPFCSITAFKRIKPHEKYLKTNLT